MGFIGEEMEGYLGIDEHGFKHQETVYTITEVKQRRALGILRDDHIATFTPRSGEPQLFQNACQGGLPHIRLHDLRHTHATLLLKSGIHPKIVSERLRHAGIGITLDTYSHVVPGLQEKAATCFDEILESKLPVDDVCKMSAKEQ
jgi:integrase